MRWELKIARSKMTNPYKNHRMFISGIVPTNQGEGKVIPLNPHLLPIILTYTKLSEPL